MAREVVFHGKVIVHPGAEAYTDLSGMIQPGVDNSKVAAIVGEAPYGQPGVVHVFSDYNTARNYFGPSDLADGIQLLMQPSNDPRVTGGAVVVYAYKANRSTSAERWLVRDPETGVFPPASGSPVLNAVILGTTEQTALRVDATSTVDLKPAQLLINNPAAPNGYAENEFANLVVEIMSGPGKGQQKFIASSRVNPNSALEYILELRDDLDWDPIPISSTLTSTFRIAAPQVKYTALEWGPPGNDYSVEFGRQPQLLSYEMQVKQLRRLIKDKEPFGGLRKPTFLIKLDPTGGGSLAEWTNPANWAIPIAQDGGNAVQGTTTISSATVLDTSENNLTASAHIDRWAIITGPTMLGSANPAASFLDVDGTTGGHGGGVSWAAAGTTITLPSSASIQDDFYNNWVVSITNDNGTTVQWLRILDYVGNTRVATLTGGTITVAPSGTATNNDLKLHSPVANPFLGKMYKILSHTAAGGGLSIDDITLAGVGLGVAPTTPLLEWKVFQATDAYLEMDGSDGKATSLKIITRDRTGSPATNVLADIVLSEYKTLDELEKKLDGISGVFSDVGDGVNRSLLSSRFDFGQMSDHYGRYISSIMGTTGSGSTTLGLQKSDEFPDPSSYGNYYVRIEPGTPREELFLVTTNTTGTDVLSSTASSTQFDHPFNSTVEFVRGSQLLGGPSDDSFIVKDNLQKLVEFVASQVGVFSATRATGAGSSQQAPGFSADSPAWNQMIGAAQPEDNLDVFKKLQGGTVGTSRVTIPDNTTEPGYPVSWESGLNELLKFKEVRVTVPLVSEDLPSFEAGDIDVFVDLFRDYLLDAEDVRAETQGYLGLNLPLEAGTFGGVTYNRGLLETIRLLNEERLSLVGQKTQVFTSAGIEEIIDPWGFACQAAGIQMGTDIGEPSTFKQLKTARLVQPFNDWDPLSKKDSDKALRGGLFFGEPNNGFWRVVRGFTTHVSSDNLARTDTNVWEVRNFLQRLIRSSVEDRFVGRGIGAVRPGVRFVAPANIGSIRTHVATLLEEQRAEGIIIDSQDENGRWIHAWSELGVRISGDVARIKFRVFPKTGLNFVLIDFAFQLPTLSA